MWRLNLSTIENDIGGFDVMAIFKKLMSGGRNKSHKIFRSIVIFSFVDMVANFFRHKIALNLIFYYKTMLKYISVRIFKRMIWRMNHNISTKINNATFPARIIFAFIGDAHFFKSFFRVPITSIHFTQFISSFPRRAFPILRIVFSKIRFSQFLNCFRSMVLAFPGYTHFQFTFFRMFKAFMSLAYFSLSFLSMFTSNSRRWLSFFFKFLIKTKTRISHFLFYFRRSLITFSFHNINIIPCLNYQCNIFKLLNINILKGGENAQTPHRRLRSMCDYLGL